MKNTLFVGCTLIISGGVNTLKAKAPETADHYKAVASDCRARANEEAAVAEHWKEHFGSWTKTPNPYSIAHNKEAAYNRCAEEAQRKANALETGRGKGQPGQDAGR